ncbi:hypothetical protein Scep_003976 [Stephania cephalantha]|uniref:Uncharacterized protein n=1 Tax=Stephania cephalantha TaxID=152367 RepID=A0AAP0PUX5_9MAGN
MDNDWDCLEIRATRISRTPKDLILFEWSVRKKKKTRERKTKGEEERRVGKKK